MISTGLAQQYTINPQGGFSAAKEAIGTLYAYTGGLETIRMLIPVTLTIMPVRGRNGMNGIQSGIYPQQTNSYYQSNYASQPIINRPNFSNQRYGVPPTSVYSAATYPYPVAYDTNNPYSYYTSSPVYNNQDNWYQQRYNTYPNGNGNGNSYYSPGLNVAASAAYQPRPAWPQMNNNNYQQVGN